MSERRDQDYLSDIREAIWRIGAYTAEMTGEHFRNDTRTQDAVVRNLEVIGEATKNLSTQIKKANPHVPWKTLAGVRDKMIHHYFGINYEIVWTIAKKEFPSLLPRIEDILTKEDQ